MSDERQVAEMVHRADMCCDLGRPIEAIAMLAPLLGSVTQVDAADVWLVMARAQLQRDDAHAALVAVGNAVQADPGLAMPHVLASSALRMLERHDEAVRAAELAVHLDPHDPVCFQQLAWVLGDVPARREDAVRAADEALRLAPDDPDLLVTRGTAAAAVRQRSEAERYFTRALAIDPQNAAAMHELARVRAHGRFVGATRLANSAAGFADALTVNPRQDVSRLQLDMVLRTFLARMSYGIFILVYVALRLVPVSSAGARLLAALGVIAPVLIAARFAGALRPELRAYLRTTVSRGRLRSAVGAQVFSLTGLSLGVLLPRRWMAGALGAATACAILARVLVYTETRTLLRSRGVRVDSALSNGAVLAMGVLALVGAGLFFMMVTLNAPIALALGAICLGLALLAFRSVIRRRRAA